MTAVDLRHPPMKFRTVIIAGSLLGSLGQAIGQVTVDSSFGNAGALAGPNFQIPDTLGNTVGGNLFHSFSDFNIQTGESATFTGPDSINNILGRVTGGDASSIDGLIRSEITGANLCLLYTSPSPRDLSTSRMPSSA